MPNEIEPVYLVPEGPAQLSEYGKRWLTGLWEDIERSRSVLLDVARLAEHETADGKWDRIEGLLLAEGVPTNVANGISQFAMAKLVDHLNNKVAYTHAGTVAMALATTAPASTSTGATLVELTYTTYARQTIAAAGFNSATAATPSVATNNGAITFPACTAGGGTVLGFMLADSATIGAGNSLWFGGLTSTVISTTQTPPTVATTAMSLSLNTSP